MGRPANFLNWVPSGNPAYIQQPPSGQSNTGWLSGQPPPFQFDNYALYTLDQWIQYLDSQGAAGLYTTVTANYTVVPPIVVVFANATGGAFTVTLPSAVLNPGAVITVKNIGSANLVMIASIAGNIDGGSSAFIAPLGVLSFKSDGANWWELVTAVNDYPNYFASTEATLASAITSAGISPGVIVLTGSFSISSAHTIPSGTILLGRDGGTIITVLSGGSITMLDGTSIRDIRFTTALTSGNMLTLPNNNSKVRECRFTIPAASTGACVYVTGNGNRLYNCFFIGVAGEIATGIDYAGGVDNIDQDSVFLP